MSRLTIGFARGPSSSPFDDATSIELNNASVRSAIAALRRWEQFNLGWVEAWPSDTPIQKGEVVAVIGRAIGIWAGLWSLPEGTAAGIGRRRRLVAPDESARQREPGRQPCRERPG